MKFIKLGFETMGNGGDFIANSKLMNVLELMIEKCAVPEGRVTVIIMPDEGDQISIRCEDQSGNALSGERVLLPLAVFVDYERDAVNSPTVNDALDALDKYLGIVHNIAYGIQK